MLTIINAKYQPETKIDVATYGDVGMEWYEITFGEYPDMVEVRLDGEQLRKVIDSAIDAYGPLFTPGPEDMVKTIDQHTTLSDLWKMVAHG
jgi:hypothetical protein